MRRCRRTNRNAEEYRNDINQFILRRLADSVYNAALAHQVPAQLPTSTAAEGSISETNMVTAMGKIIFSVRLTGLS